MIKNSDTCVIIFAKFPAKGMAKTRLQPALGVEGAAKMARKLLLHSISEAVAIGFTVELCVSPAPNDPCWQKLKLSDISCAKPLQWSAQADGDLGTRMLNASKQALKNFKKVILIGSDCPSLTALEIENAAAQLSHHDTVMVPAFDGGYILLGFKQIDRCLFSNIAWSTASVAAITQERITTLGWSLACLAPLPDIDEPDDLRYLPDGWLGDTRPNCNSY